MADENHRSEFTLPYPAAATTVGEILRLAVCGYPVTADGTPAMSAGGDVCFDEVSADDAIASIEAMRSARKIHGEKFDDVLSALIAMFDSDNKERRYRERDWHIRTQYFVFAKTQKEIAEDGQPSRRKNREENDGKFTDNLSEQSVGDIIRSTPIHNRRALETYRLELCIRLSWARKRSKADYRRFCELWSLSERQQDRLKRFFRGHYTKPERSTMVLNWEGFHDAGDMFNRGFYPHGQPGSSRHIEELYLYRSEKSDL